MTGVTWLAVAVGAGRVLWGLAGGLWQLAGTMGACQGSLEAGSCGEGAGRGRAGPQEPTGLCRGAR